MIKSDFIVGKKVIHSKYGLGTVMGLEDVYMTIVFADENTKRFKYPDAFEGFLSAVDKSLQQQIEKDLEDRHTEADYAENMKSREIYEKMRSFQKKKAAEQEEKRQLQIERQRRSQMMSRQRMQQFGK